MTPRLTSDMWIAAYRKRLELMGIPAFVTAKGDATAGAILIRVSTMNGHGTLFQRNMDVDGKRVWTVLAEGTDAELSEAEARQRAFDPDLWIIEVEDPAGRHLLFEEGL